MSATVELCGVTKRFGDVVAVDNVSLQVKSGEFLGSMLLSWANVAFYQQLMDAMRTAIAEGRFAAWATETRARFGGTETGSDP